MFQIADESMLSHTRREAPRYSSSPFIFGLARAISKRCLSRRLRRLQCTVVQAAVQKKPSGTEKRRPTEPPWYHGKFRVMSSRLADWLSCPEDVRPARQVVQLLWKYPGNVSNLVAHEAAQCVAFRAAATTVMYGPSLEHEAPSGWTIGLVGDKPPSFAGARGGRPQEFDPSAAVCPEAFIKALVWLINPSKGTTSAIQPAAASGLAMLLRDAGDAVAGPALDTGACELLVKALKDSTPVTFSTRTSTWTASLRHEAAEALHNLVALQTPEGCAT